HLFRLAPSRWTGPCLRVLQLHVCLIYILSGLEKLSGHTWRNGEALWKTLHLPYFNPGALVDFSMLGNHAGTVMLMRWGVVLTELLYPLFIWIPSCRKAALSLIVTLHIGIAMVLKLYLFSAMMITFNVAAFYFDFTENKAPRSIRKSPCH